MRNYIVQMKLIFPEETYNQVILKFLFALPRNCWMFAQCTSRKGARKKVEYELKLMVFFLKSVNLAVKIKTEKLFKWKFQNMGAAVQMFKSAVQLSHQNLKM